MRLNTWCTICDQTILSCTCQRKFPNIIKYRLEMMTILEIIQALQTCRVNQNSRNSSSTCGIFATSRLSRSASVRVHVDVRNGHGRARGVVAAPRRRRSNKPIFDREFQFLSNRILRSRQKLLTKSLTLKKNYIYNVGNGGAIARNPVPRGKYGSR